MAMYLQKLDALLAVGDTPTRHRVAITLCSIATELDRKLERARDDRQFESLAEAIASLDDIASHLCAQWYGTDYDDPDVYGTGEYSTDRLLRLCSTGATIN